MYRTLTLSYLITHFKIHFGQKIFLLPNMFYNFSLTFKSIPKKFSKIFFRPLEKLSLAKNVTSSFQMFET